MRTRGISFNRGLLALLLCVWSLSSWAGELFDFSRFSDQLGGRQSTVYEIFEDHQGFLWFAGDTDGLLRYDGHELMSWTPDYRGSEVRHNVSTQIITRGGRLWVGSWGNGLQLWNAKQQRFIHYMSDSVSPEALADNRVQTFLEDSHGRLWIGTVAGINYIDPDFPEQVRRFLIDQPDHPLYRERIWRMVEVDEDIWLATSSGVYQVGRNGRDWQHHELPATAEASEHERADEVRTIALAHGRIWVASQLGVFYWNVESRSFHGVGFSDDPTRAIPRVNELLESRDQDIWVGAHDGLYRINAGRRVFVQSAGQSQLIPDVDVRALHEDIEGNLWIGTRDQGLIFARRQQQTFTPLSTFMPPELADAGGRLSSALLTDEGGRLWVSFPGGILRQNADGQWKKWNFPSRDGVRRVERLASDGQERIWIATDAGLYFIDASDRLHAETSLFDQLGIGALPVNELWIEPGGCIWLALWHHGLVCWDASSGQVELFLTELQRTRGDSVYHLAHDEDADRLWAATRYAGLFSIDLTSRTAQRRLLVNDGRHEPSYYCAVPDQDGDVLWLCTGDGLIKLDLASGEQRSFSTQHGLPAPRISGFFQHPTAGRWALTPNGLARLLPGGERFVSFGLADGLPGLGLQRNAVTLDPWGRLLVGTSSGVAVLQTPELPTEYPAPGIVLSRAWVGGDDMTRRLDPLRPEIHLAAHERDLLLQFAVLDFHDPTGNVMRLKLRGLDNDFGPFTSDRSVRYVNLSPGDYELVVEAWNSRGVQSREPLILPISVAAPWWQSIWVVAVVILFLLSTGWLLAHMRVRGMQAANVRLQSMVDERTRALAEANDQLRVQSTHDFLTGLLNRRGFSDRFTALQRRRTGSRQPISLILFDLDHFKVLNDRYGHDAGDRVLRLVAEILKEKLPESALAARWGGEEFLVALEGVNLDRATAICQELRQAFTAQPVFLDDKSVPYSATFGVVCDQSANLRLEDLLRHVDQLLYQGKRGGRDCIRVQEGNEFDPR